MKIKNNNFAKQYKGITLIALVITIILLLILAGITISSLGGENGLFAKTKQAKIEQMKAEAKENITLAIMEIQIDDTEQGKETTLQTLHDKLPSTDTRIAVNDYNTGETELTGIYDAGEKQFNYIIDEFFNVTIGDEVDTKPETLKFSPITWNSGTAEVTISTETTDTIQYQINGTEEGSWTTGTTGTTTVTGLNHSDKLYARLTNGSTTTEPEELEIKDIIKPEEFTITVSNPTPTRVTVTGNTVDNQTGIKDYTYVAVPTTGDTVEFTNITETTYEMTGLEPNTEYTIYMIAYDKAGNEIKSNKEKQTTQNLEMEITQPYIGTSTTTTDSASSVADNSQSRGTTLYINFSATIQGTACTIVNKDDNQAIPYAITQNGTYTFIVTGTYDGKEVTEEVEVVVNKYETETELEYDDVVEVINSKEEFSKLLETESNVNSLVLNIDTYKEIIINNQTAMECIGNDEYAGSKMIQNKEWREAILESAYIEDFNKGATTVPTMTSNTSPEGEAFVSYLGDSALPFRCFDGDDATEATIGRPNTLNGYIGYTFTQKVVPYYVSILNYIPYYNHFANIKIQGQDETGTWVDLTDVLSINDSGWSYIPLKSDEAYHEYQSLRILQTTDKGSPYYAGAYTIQFYCRSMTE